MMKTYAKIGEDVVYPINNDDLQFRVSYQKESDMNSKTPAVRQLISEWPNTKKNFRYINRVSFTKDKLPIRFDLSVVKSSVNSKQYNIQDSGVFNATEAYEIEIEVLNHMLDYYGGGVNEIERELKRQLRFSPVYRTQLPIGIKEQTEVAKAYHMLLHQREREKIQPRDFCGPASFTLELKNIQPLDEGSESSIPNIRQDYTVTDKADGV